MAEQNKNTKQNATPKTVRKRDKKWLIIIILIAVLIVGIVSTIIILNATKPKSTENSDSNTSSTPVASENTSSDVSAPVTTNEGDNKTPAQYEGENPNNYDILTGIITYTGITNDKLVISAALDQFVTGDCKFEIYNQDQLIFTGHNKIMAGPSSSFCNYSADIPAQGKYNLKVIPTSDNNKTGVITGEVEI